MADEAARHADHRPRLGRGLAALIGDAGEEPGAGRGAPRKAPIEFLRPNPRNPRKSFREDELDELAASIRERGVIQPVIVRPVPRVADAYEIIAGAERPGDLPGDGRNGRGPARALGEWRAVVGEQAAPRREMGDAAQPFPGPKAGEQQCPGEHDPAA